MNNLKTWDQLSLKEKEALIAVAYDRYPSIKDTNNKTLELAQSEQDPMLWVYWMDDQVGPTVFFQDTKYTPSGWDHTFRVPASKIKEMGVLIKDWEQAVKDGRVIA